MLLPLLVACMAGLAAAGRAPTELSTNVIITSFYDLEAPALGGRTRCEAVVAASRGFNARRIGFVLTLQAQGSEHALGRYFYDDWVQTQGRVAADAGSIARFQAGLQRCFQAAVEAGFTTLHIMPHVDPFEVKPNAPNGRGLWRNVVRFDPLAKVGPPGAAFSYDEVLLQPAARALSAAVRDDTVVEFALAGEQGLSLFAFPSKWRGLLGATRALSAAGKRNATLHHMGVSLNWDKVCGCVEPQEPDPLLYNRTYAERLGRWWKSSGDKGPKAVDIEGLRQLLQAADFIGLSGYAPIPAPLGLPAMESSIQTAAYELGLFGIDILELTDKQGKSIIYSEHGLGGCDRTGAPSPNLAFLRTHPFLGIWPPNGYNPAQDPWAKAEFRQYRRDWYSYVLQWARAGGGPQYRVDGIYTWSVGSWDPQGVHPASSSTQGSYADPEISNAIRASNAAVYSIAAAVPRRSNNSGGGGARNGHRRALRRLV